jgi:hypothetical protein
VEEQFFCPFLPFARNTVAVDHYIVCMNKTHISVVNFNAQRFRIISSFMHI